MTHAFEDGLFHSEELQQQPKLLDTGSRHLRLVPEESALHGIGGAAVLPDVIAVMNQHESTVRQDFFDQLEQNKQDAIVQNHELGAIVRKIQNCHDELMDLEEQATDTGSFSPRLKDKKADLNTLLVEYEAEKQTCISIIKETLPDARSRILAAYEQFEKERSGVRH